MANIGPRAKAASPKFNAMLKEETELVQVQVAAAICRVERKNRQAFNVLVRALGKPLLRVWAAGSLGALGRDAAEAAPALVRLLQEPADASRTAVIFALGNMR